MELENIVDNLIAILKELPDWTEISVWELLKTIDDKKYTTKELLFSGAGYGVAPSDGEGYYADTGKFQTLTQQSANKMFYNNSKHYMNRSSGTNYSANIRPVIAIASDSAYILGGSGTKLDPYRLKVVPPSSAPGQ